MCIALGVPAGPAGAGMRFLLPDRMSGEMCKISKGLFDLPCLFQNCRNCRKRLLLLGRLLWKPIPDSNGRADFPLGGGGLLEAARPTGEREAFLAGVLATINQDEIKTITLFRE